MPPKISVIIPAYNEEKLISACVSAIKGQAYPQDQIEILVVNNDSKDATASLASQAGARVIDYAQLHTVGAVRNAGAAQAQGQMLAFIDADTLPGPTWLSDIDRLLSSGNLVGVGGVGLP